MFRRRAAAIALGLVSLAAVGVGAALIVLFVARQPDAVGSQPDAVGRQPDALVDAGSVDDFAPASVTTFEENRFHLVRLEGGEFLALYWTDPHLGCTVPWRPDFEFQGKRGFFRNPCHGETYDIAGHRVFGPSPRDLDRYEVKIEGSRVLVDTSQLICGFSTSGVYPSDHCRAPTTP